MTPYQTKIHKKALSLADLIPTDDPSAKDFTVNPGGNGFTYNEPSMQPMQPQLPPQSPIQSGGAVQSPIQARPAPQSPIQQAPAPKPAAPAPTVQFKAPTMPTNTDTPFKAPQIPGAGASPSAGGPPMVSFNKQAAFDIGFNKQAQSYRQNPALQAIGNGLGAGAGALTPMITEIPGFMTDAGDAKSKKGRGEALRQKYMGLDGGLLAGGLGGAGLGALAGGLSGYMDQQNTADGYTALQEAMRNGDHNEIDKLRSMLVGLSDSTPENNALAGGLLGGGLGAGVGGMVGGGIGGYRGAKAYNKEVEGKTKKASFDIGFQKRATEYVAQRSAN